MDREQWLGIFREMTDAAIVQSNDINGTTKAKEVIGKGAGGDMTVFIDKVMEDIIVRRLETIGDVRLISEELGMTVFGDPKCTVVADPLDGSFNAKMGIPVFAMSLALLEGDLRMGNIVLGYVRNLVNGDEYQALTGKGAFFNRNAISPSNRKEVSIISMECHPNTILALKQNLALSGPDTRLRSLGCISLDLCHVARGICDTFIDVRGRSSRIVDMAAGKIIIEEAGGLVTDENGSSIDEVEVNINKRISFIASGNRSLHDQVISVLGEKGLLE